MSNRTSSLQPLGPLSVGDVVNIALQIYRYRFLAYYKQSLIAHLWLLVFGIPISFLLMFLMYLIASFLFGGIALFEVITNFATIPDIETIIGTIIGSIGIIIIIGIIPFIYGWAKFLKISGLISRLAYQEVLKTPETVSESRRQIKPGLCTFLFTAILVFLIILTAIIVTNYIVFSNPIYSFNLVGMNLLFGDFSLIYLLSLLLVFLILILFYTWLYCRIFLTELPITVESIFSPIKTIGRSWKLTKGLVIRIMLIFTIAFLITTPFLLIVQILSYLLYFLLSLLPQEGLFSLISAILAITINIGGTAVPLPFWQILKAVTYYDLRTRKEAIDLELGKS